LEVLSNSTTSTAPTISAVDTLPHTGSESVKLLAVGLLLLVGGGLSLVVGDDRLQHLRQAGSL
jgi:LPXTG-motif cell wall-anchored protein